ncbi:cilia- and flagella-associated protein 99-like [Epargyreus clarus]|uniref:cilia- and flagella-associated protein 99-like n=1 Tax=Epargyreus clarus TaxID=520877 RepID=UPI003C305CC2
MVYYFTSGNVKLIRNLVIDYEATSDISPHEYMKTYIEKCPETTEDAKISWIVETFLGVQKHNKFLREIGSNLSEELSGEDQEYFAILFHGIIFQITPTDMQNLYKCLFNLSKPLLDTFSNFLGNKEVLNFISDVAQSGYDTNFITDKIINPIFVWQPYLSEMANSYAQYVKKTESRKIKLPTIPLQPNVLNRKGKDVPLHSLQSPIPDTPPNSICHKGKKMLTKYAIDQRLKQMHIQNKQKAILLLNKVKNKNSHYAQGKSDKYYKTIQNIECEMINQCEKPLLKLKRNFDDGLPQLEVKETAATLKRMNKRIQITEQQETQWLQDLMDNCRNTAKIEELEEFDRQEKERERLIDIEKKHLMGQISYEEAVIAKKKLKDYNKKKYEDFLKEKQAWEDEIENWKKIITEKNRKAVEKLSLLELNVLESKNNAVMKKREIAENVKKESENIIAKAMKEKQEELERRINMIKEIKILSMIAKKAKLPKIIDLTESSGLGLLCEMSMAELQERLSIMKISLKEELEQKKKIIKEDNIAAKKELDKTKEAIKNYMTERTTARKQSRKVVVDINTKEIIDLKKRLEEKRKLRMQMTS